MDLEVDLNLKQGFFYALCGESGSGKTTFLRILAGLESSQSFIKVKDTLWHDKKIFLPPQKRQIGFVFQDYALFPNMSIEQNLLYVKNDKKLCQKLLSLTGLLELKNRYPHALSGGQQQRVALARAMMNKPKLLLLDEPLSALDPSLRQKLQHEILLLHNEFQTTTIMVSHDSTEIYRLADTMIELDKGKMLRFGDPKKLLLKTKGSQKFSYLGVLLDIKKVDTIYIAIVALGQQITQVVLSKNQANTLQIGDKVTVNTKAFNLNITKENDV